MSQNLEGGVKGHEQEEAELIKNLNEERAKSSPDIYQIARCVQVLQTHGYNVTLTQQERDAVTENLNQAREGKSQRPIEQGYEIARWFFLCKFFAIPFQIEGADRVQMDKAIQKFKTDKNWRQLASFVITCRFIGIDIPLSDLKPSDRKEVEEAINDLE